MFWRFRRKAEPSAALAENQAPATFEQAVSFYQHGDLERARAVAEEFLRAHPRHFEAIHFLGVVAYQTGRRAEALQLFDQSIAIEPGQAAVYCHRGTLLHDLRMFDAAIASFDKAIALKPDFAEAYCSRGISMQELGQQQAAAQSYARAVAIAPLYADAHANRGLALRELGQLDTAVACFDQAIAINPNHVSAYTNRGIALQELLRLQDAITSYNKALAIQPDFAPAHWNRSLALMLLGDFAIGLEEFEWRWKTASTGLSPRNFPQPLWLGHEPIENKTILLHCEQGLGDSIHFCRYATLASRLGARVILEVQTPLVGLLTRLEGVTAVLAQGSVLPDFDCHCPLLSLPLAFKTRLDNIPSARGYLQADANKLAQWRQKLGDRHNPRVGLVWSGNQKYVNDRNRSIALSDLLSLLPDGFQYVSLQKELRVGDARALESRPDIHDFSHSLVDFSDTAALCELMDLVISVDTSAAHLSAALDRPTWILLPFLPDWRWQLGRSDSPWYPSAKLYRQAIRGDWADVLVRVTADLRQFAPSAQAGLAPSLNLQDPPV